MTKKTILWTISLIILGIVTVYGVLYYLQWRDEREWDKLKQENQEEEQKEIQVSPEIPLPAPGENGEVIIENPISETNDIEPILNTPLSPPPSINQETKETLPTEQQTKTEQPIFIPPTLLPPPAVE